MADRERAQQELRDEAEGMAAGPGVVASKSQTSGAIGGVILGGVLGAIVGLMVGLIFFEGAVGIVISVIAFALAGAIGFGVSGGFVRPRQKLEGSEADR